MKRREQGFTPATERAVEGILNGEPIDQVRADVRRLIYTNTKAWLIEQGYAEVDAEKGAREILGVGTERRILTGKYFKNNTRKK